MSRLAWLFVFLTACAAPQPPPPVAPTASQPTLTEARTAEGERLRSLGRYEEAERAFLEITGDPTVSPDDQGYAWWMIGEIDFEAGNLERAEAAYAYVLAGLAAESPMRSVVAYKLAWTSYRRDHYEDALERFARVLSSSVPEGVGDLHAEAIEYMAIIVAEDDWDLDGAPDAQLGLDRPEVVAWRARVATAPWVARFHEALAATYDALALPGRATEARRLSP